MSIEYDIYLNEHIENVQRGLAWMRDNLKVNALIDERAMDIACENALIHDSTKTSSEEYPAYDAYFYGGNRSYKVCQDFDYAWLHHQKLNPHHWQYWILIKDKPDEVDPFDTEFNKPGPTLKPLLIPLEYVYEMIADWWTFSWKNGNLFEIFKWYNLNSPYMLMHDKTKAIVNCILQEMYKILIMQETVAGHDITDIEKQYMLYFMRKNEPEPIVEHSDILKDDEDLYGVPELKKFPMPDKDHVKSAIRFFNYVDPKHEKELAEAILEKAEEFGLDLENDISVGDENRFKKYIPKEEKKG